MTREPCNRDESLSHLSSVLTLVPILSLGSHYIIHLMVVYLPRATLSYPLEQRRVQSLSDGRLFTPRISCDDVSLYLLLLLLLFIKCKVQIVKKII